jgi:protein-L-isoaspartate(D-aspartate) O-methyltransferase
MQDTPRHKGMRKQLIEELKQMGIDNQAVLNAFDQVPRHLFLDPVFEKQAYSNVAFQIGAGQTISQPYTVAFQTSLLEVERGMKVLEIGTGSAFQTAILAKIGAKVYSVERQSKLHLLAKENCRHPAININPKLFFGDGYKGLPQYAPFDRVLVTCGAPFVPEALLSQLKIGGIMVIPLGEDGVQIMTKIVKVDDVNYESSTYGDFSFVPMLNNTAK